MSVSRRVASWARSCSSPTKEQRNSSYYDPNSNYGVFVKAGRLHFPRPRQLFVEGLLGQQRRLLAYVVVSGFVGGLVGAAYIGLLHLFQSGLWPTHWDTLPHLFVLVGV